MEKYDFEPDYDLWDDLLTVGCLIATVYPAFQIIAANKKLIDMLGYDSLEEMKKESGGSMLSFVYPEDMPRILSEASKRNGDFSPYEITYRLLCKNGRYRWIKQCSKHYKSSDNRELIAASYMDISDEKMTQIRFHEFVDNLPGGVFYYTADREERMIYVSPHFYELLGYTPQEFSRTFHDRFSLMVYEEDRGRVLKEIDDQILTSDYDTCEYRIKKKDGSLIWVSDAGHKVTDIDGKQYFYVVVVDITKSELLKQALDKANQLNTAKGEFLSRMSHDIRTPMNAIIGLTTLAIDEPNLTPQVDDYLRKIKYSSRFLLGLVNDILDVSKIESGALTLVPSRYDHSEFKAMINTIIGPLCREKNITFNFDSSSDSRGIFVDKIRFDQIFINLLSNAVKFTPPGGTITYSIRNRAAHDGMLTCDYIISDTGIGIRQDFIKRMFEPFTQDNEAGTSENRGTGLGLTIVKSLVDLMGGTILVSGAPGKGTTVVIHLSVPLAPPEEESEEESPKVNFSILKDKIILLAEDHPLNTEVAKKLLEKQSIIVRCARNGQEACDMYASSAPYEIDIILMDIRMPVMDGLTAVKNIRSMNRADAKRIPIIAITANASYEDADLSHQAGMNGYVTKPIDPKILYETIAENLERVSKPLT